MSVVIASWLLQRGIRNMPLEISRVSGLHYGGISCGDPALDPTLVSGLSALLGSFVGAAATILTTWINYNYQARNARLQADIEQREKLYSDFINTCCKLAVDSYQRSLESAEIILPAYALLNRIRLFSSDAVLAAAEQTVQSILDRYFSKNMATEQLYNLAISDKVDFDLVRSFSEACRQELKILRSRA